MDEIPEIRVNIQGKLLTTMTFAFQVNRMKYADDTGIASVKLMKLGYKVNIL